MKKFLLAGVMLALAVGVMGVLAQETPAAGEGGTIVWGNQRGSSNLGPLLPIRCSGVDCADVNGLMYPSLIGLDPSNLSFTPYTPGGLVSNAMATGWEVQEGGTVYVITLRDDMVWSDGTPITANDVVFTFNAIKNGDLIGLSSSYAPARNDIANVEAIDDFTLRVTFNQANCLALNRAALLLPLPSHAFGWTPSSTDFDWSTLNGGPFDKNPSVTAGPFQFTRLEPGTAVYLQANPLFKDNQLGYTVPTGVVYLDVPDYNVMAERLLAGQAGDVNYMHEVPGAILNTLRDGGANVFSEPGSIWHYVSLNLADPSDPKNGFDEDGNPVDQGFHPILGDVRVRQALQHAVDIDAIINGAQNGNAGPMVSSTIPSAYTIHPTLERRPFDLDAARRLLDEAGWKSTGEPLVRGGDGQRTCVDCLHAEPGTVMFLDIMAPDQPRTDAATLIQANLALLGIDAEVRTLDFNTMYDNNMGAQIYDMGVAGWRGGIPFNADQRSFFGFQQDIANLGSGEYGFNFGSYYNAEFEALSEYIFAGATADGCDQEKIKQAAYKVQEILWEDQPYLWLYALNSSYIAAPTIVDFAPFPAQGVWNISTWYLRQ
ncbi:MAG: ABC transporter substrate-binding protein [Anaerolineae bacterium]|nr:ABC transporter substrate-binding protein [Anaerolineae bacterium]